MIPDISDPTLGRRLEVIRVYRGLTQSQLALLVNASQSAIARWENDERRPPWDVCRKICEITRFKESFLSEAYHNSEDKVSESRTKGQLTRHAKQLSTLPLVESSS